MIDTSCGPAILSVIVVILELKLFIDTKSLAIYCTMRMSVLNQCFWIHTIVI
jgi:hypothetical protein